MSILILTGCTIAGAVVGAGLMWWLTQDAVDYLRLERDVYQNKARKAEKRISAALTHIGPYHRGANGTAQKIGKILRGER